MALRTPPSWLQNGSHPAENDRLTMQAIFNTTGVIGLSAVPTALQVTQSAVPGMSVSIDMGYAAIVGTTQSNMGVYTAYNDAATTATITTANPSNPRIDRVCLTVSDAFYTGALNTVAINVIAGTPAGSPTAPATPANSISLATIAVAAGATSILNANITDTRAASTTLLPVTLDPTIPVGYATTVTAAGTTTLTATSAYTQYFTGTSTQTIVLPVASTMTLGEAFVIHNNSTGALTVNSSGANLVATIPAGNTWLITCVLTSGTTAASWDADFTGTSLITGIGATVLQNNPVIIAPEERTTVAAIAATGTIQYDYATQGVLFYTTAATGAFTLNLRANATTTFNSSLAVGDAATFVFMNTNTGTAFFTSTLTIDGNAQTVRWQNGTAPTAGNINSTDIYTFTVIKTAATPTYTVLGSLTRFA
jgi:hypothetical protein